MKITLKDIEIVRARICGCCHLDEIVERFNKELELISASYANADKSQEGESLRFTERELEFLRNRRDGA